MKSRTTSGTPRRTHAERSAETRALLLDATIEALTEVGYAALTTTDVVRRAGLSRGAQVHHFPHKTDLVNGAIERLARRTRHDMQAEARSLPNDMDRVEAVLELLWSTYRGPLFWAGMELTVAGRTEVELQPALEVLEHEVGTTLLELCRNIFGDDASTNQDLRRAVELSMYFMTGAAVAGMQKPAAWLDDLMVSWRSTARTLFESVAVGEAPMTVRDEA